MMWNLLKKDIYLNILESRIQILGIAIFTLTIVLTVIGMTDYKERIDRYNFEQKANIEEIKNNRVYATIKPRAIRRPSQLSLICKGMSLDVGSVVEFDLLNIQYDADRIINNNTYTKEFIKFDVTQIFIWIFSLFAILLSYDTISQEKERGTINLLLCSNLSKTALFFSKFIASVISVALLLIGTFFIVITLYFIVPELTLNFNTLLSLILFFLVLLLYITFWSSVGILSSIVAKSSSQSLIASLAVWIILLIVLPSTVKSIIGPTHFSEEKEEIELLNEDIMGEYWNKQNDIWGNKIYPLINELKFLTFGGSPGREPIWGANPLTTEASIDFYNTLNPMKDDFAKKKHSTVEARYLIPLRNKIREYNKLSYLSPALLCENILRQISQTSFEDYHRYLNNTLRYREQVIDYFNQKKAYRSKRWFTPEDDLYPFSSNHLLSPKDPNKLTKAEIEKFSEYYSAAREDEKFILNLDDFPIFSSNNSGLLGFDEMMFGIFTLIIYTLAIIFIAVFVFR